MNYLDYIFIIFTSLLFIRGLIKGFVVEIASLIALVGGVWGAYHFSGYAENILSEYVDWEDGTLRVASFVFTMILIVVAVHLIAKMVEKMMGAIALGWLNRLAGGVFGIVKALIFVLAFIFCIEEVSAFEALIKKEDRKASILYPTLKDTMIMVTPHVKNTINEFNERSKKDGKWL